MAIGVSSRESTNGAEAIVKHVIANNDLLTLIPSEGKSWICKSVPRKFDTEGSI